MSRTRQFIQFLCYVLIPIAYTLRGFYLYENIPLPVFKRFASSVGYDAWGIFLVIMFAPVCARLLAPLGGIAHGFRWFHRYNRELIVLSSWLFLLHSLFIALSIRNFNAALTAISNLQSNWSWGALAAISALIIGITSNHYAQRLLKSWWERSRFLIYFTFIFGSLHVSIIRGSLRYWLGIMGSYIVLQALSVWLERRRTASASIHNFQ